MTFNLNNKERVSELNNLIVAAIILIAFLIIICTYESFKERKAIKKEKEKENQKKYILNVITVHEDGGVSSHWHGWSSKWLFTHDEAVAKKEEIKEFFSEVEILEHEDEQKDISVHLEKL